MAPAQSPAFFHLSTAEGLSDNNVNTSARDRNGILWIGTTEGLNSFDGNRITTYYRHQYPQLADNFVERIVIDGENQVWIRTNSPFITMLDKQRRFHKFPVGDTTSSGNITSLFVSEKGVFAIRNRKHYLLKKNNGTAFEPIATPFDSLQAGTGFTHHQNNDTAFYYRSGTLYVADYKAMKLVLSIAIPGLNGARNTTRDRVIAYDAEKTVFYLVSINEKKIIAQYNDIRDQHGLPIAPRLRNSVRIDHNRLALTNYFSGLYIIDFSQSPRAYHYAHDPVDPRTIGGNNTFNISYDTSGYLFVTTQTSGLHFFNLNQKNASYKPYFIDNNKQIFDGYIQSVTTNKEGDVWMGAQDRLIKWERTTGNTQYVPLRVPGKQPVTEGETIREVLVGADGRIWVGTSRLGLLVLDQSLRTLKQITDSANGGNRNFPSRLINTLCTDKHGNKWAGTPFGTCIVNSNNYEVTSLRNHPLLGEMSKLPCAFLWMDETGSIWMGTTRGAWCYNETANTLKHYNTKNGLADNMVYAINKDLLGNVYFATAGGLSILSPNGQFTNYQRANGLRNDRCEGVLRDERGFMWIGNLNCIIRFDPRNKTFAVYEEGYGFSHGGFRMRCAHASATGEMFWGTDKGLVSFFPEQMNHSPFPLRPYINTLQAENTWYHFTEKNKLSFPYNTSSFVFSFSSGELSGDKKNQFLYQLAGFDKEWRQPTLTGQAVYSKLPPGSYTFMVKASRDGITWYEAGYPVEIVIRSPWWQRTGFRLLVVAFALGLLLLAFRYFKRRKETRQHNRLVEYFAASGYKEASVENILWDIAHNCIAQMGFEDCVIYLKDEERNVLLQKAAYGPKTSSATGTVLNPIEIPVGKGIVGSVAETGRAELVHDTAKDSRYIVDDARRLSELTVPIIHDGKVIGIIDSEHRKRRFFNRRHLKTLQTIASLCSAKISRAMAMEAMQKSKMELMELNVKMAESKFLNLRLQMNPHFLFNSLSSIQHLIVSQQTTRAYKYLTVFSNFLRSMLKHAEKNFIPLDEELKILNMYTELESLRFDQSFHYEVLVDDGLSGEEVLVPSLLVQPFAENAIWHGLLHKEGEKKLHISFSADTDDQLVCVVEDNGVGRKRSEEIQKNKISSLVHESRGIQIIKERLELLQKKTGKPATVTFTDLYTETGEVAGTRVTIIIPYYNPEAHD